MPLRRSKKCCLFGLSPSPGTVSPLAPRIVVDLSLTKRDWMLQLCDVMLAFYPHEIEKITDRISYFGKVRQFWTERV